MSAATTTGRLRGWLGGRDPSWLSLPAGLLAFAPRVGVVEVRELVRMATVASLVTLLVLLPIRLALSAWWF